MYSNPAKKNVIAPTISFFQEIIKTAVRINTGILCNRNAKIVCQNVKPVPKTSKDIKAINAMRSIDKILGVQYMNLLIFFIIEVYIVRLFNDFEFLASQAFHSFFKLFARNLTA